MKNKQLAPGMKTDTFELDFKKSPDGILPVIVTDVANGQVLMYHTFNDTLGYHYTLEAFAGLGQMYVQDERFTENLRQYGEGFPEFLAVAMTYYAQKV